MTDAIVEHSHEMIRKGSRSFAAAAWLFEPETRSRAYMLYAWCRHCDDQIDGQDLGFGNATMPCFVPPTQTTQASLCAPDAATQNTYVFWDPFHPTAGTGAVMAQYAITAIGR